MAAGNNGRTVLLGEDDLEICSYLETVLKCEGYSVRVAQDGEEVLACLHASDTTVSAVVLDMIMPGTDGIQTLKEIQHIAPGLPVIMMSDAASSANIIDAMKSGATDFLLKPVKPEDLRRSLKTICEVQTVTTSMPPRREAVGGKKQVFFGSSPYMQELQRVIHRIGWSEVPVLIQGETGVGKEVIARELHAQSPRANRPLLKLNCAALPSELIESELFGYERGAFTGAFQKKPGMFELADGGTILLDEIGDMEFKLQAKLLQVLQDQEFQRLGGKDTIRVDVRVIAATHRELDKAIAQNTFREDLYYRLSVINIQVPPLRERKEDLIQIAEVLLKKHTPPRSHAIPFPLSLRQIFLGYDWPGNIRELENVIRKFLVFQDVRLIEQDISSRINRKPGSGAVNLTVTSPVDRVPLESVPIQGNGNGADADGIVPVLEEVAQAKRDAERKAILTALKSTNWNRRQAAVLLRIDYKALLYKMGKLSIKKERLLAATPSTPVEISSNRQLKLAQSRAGGA